jgi:hypothetical protein
MFEEETEQCKYDRGCRQPNCVNLYTLTRTPFWESRTPVCLSRSQNPVNDVDMGITNVYKWHCMAH